MKRMTLILAAALLVFGTACDEKKADGEGTTAEAQTTTTTAEGEGGDEGAAAEEATSMTPEEFAAAAPGNVCTWVTTCKNQEITVSVSAMMGMVAGFGSMGNPDLQAKIKPINESMKAESRMVPNAEECGVLAGVTAEVMGFDGSAIKASQDAGNIEFNGEKAAACSEALKGQFDACSQEKKVEGDVKLSALDTMMKAYEKDLEAHLKPCEEMIVGKVAADAACTQDYECADGGKCKAKEPGSEEKTCVAAPAEAPAEEEGAE